MKFTKLLAAPLATIAIAVMSTTLTGCGEDILGSTTPGSIDTVKISKLGVPTVDSVEVITKDSIHLHISGSYVKSEDFSGYAVFKAGLADSAIDNANLVAIDTIEAKGDTFGIILDTIGINLTTNNYTIDDDVNFDVCSFDKKGRISQAVKATFYGRNTTAGLGIVNYYGAATTDSTGLDIDGDEVVVKIMEQGIDGGSPVDYATNRGGDVIVENLTGDKSKFLITPIGGAVMFKVEETTQLSDEDVKTIYDGTYEVAAKEATITTKAGDFKAFSQGRSVRDDAGAPVVLAAGDNYFVITNSYNVARIVVKATSITNGVTLDVLKDSGKNAGKKLRNK